jgi:hypothetical protein
MISPGREAPLDFGLERPDAKSTAIAIMLVTSGGSCRTRAGRSSGFSEASIAEAYGD